MHVRPDGLARFAFDLYDSDSSGWLGPAEVERMIAEVFGAGAADGPLASALRQKVDAAAARKMTPGGEPIRELSLAAFVEIARRHETLLFPVFAVQAS